MEETWELAVVRKASPNAKNSAITPGVIGRPTEPKDDVEWSSDVAASARRLFYFSAVLLFFGFFEIDPESTFFGLRLQNFDQRILFYAIALVSLYWSAKLVFLVVDEWPRVKVDNRDRTSLLERNLRVSESLCASLKWLERETSFDKYCAEIERIIEVVPQAKELIFKRTQNTVGLTERVNLLARYVENYQQVLRDILSGIKESNELVRINRRHILLSRTKCLRIVGLEFLAPLSLYLFALTSPLWKAAIA